MTAASMTRQSRDPVRRGAIDIRHPEALRRRPFGRQGNNADARLYQRAAKLLIRKMREISCAEGGGRGIVSELDISVFDVLIDAVTFASGVCDLANSQVTERRGGSKNATIQSRLKLDRIGLVGITRRSMATGLEKVFGVPQRIQVSNLHEFLTDRLAPRWRALFNEILDDLRRKAAACGGRTASKRPAKGSAPKRERRYVASKMNPAGVRRVMQDIERSSKEPAAVPPSTAQEQASLEFVQANLLELQAQMRAQSG